MRKYCASSLSFGAYDLDTALGGIKQAGFDSVEIVCARQHGEEARAAARDPESLKSLLEKHGLGLRSFLGAAGGPASEEAIQRLVQLMDLAPQVGTRLITLASGGKEEATEGEIQQIAASLRRVTAEAAQRGITLALYAHAGTAAYNIARTQQILDATPSPALRFYYSPYHFALAGDDPLVALDAFKQRLHCVYFNCEPNAASGRGRPMALDKVDYAKVGARINEIYRGDVMLILLGGKPRGPEDIVRGLTEAREEIRGYLGESGGR